MTESTLYSVDASIYVFRGWFTLPDSIVDSDGNSVNAVVGFADFLAQLLTQRRPTHLICAFDESLTSSWRNDLYPEYKANRESAPDDLKYQFKLCQLLVQACGLHGFSSPELEADDIIATLAMNARAQGFRNVLVTADKDLTQILRGDDHWWDFAKDNTLDSKGVEKKFGVRPDQISDLLALAGDTVDNIPGVPGIGAKTAAKLLVRWNDVDNLLANLDGVAEMKMRGAKRTSELLATHRELVEVSSQITTMRHDDTLPKEMSQLARRPPDDDGLEELFDHLEFGEPRRKRLRDALTGT